MPCCFMIKLVITRFLRTLFYTVVESNSEKTFNCALLFESVGQSNQDKACGCGELECSKEW